MKTLIGFLIFVTNYAYCQNSKITDEKIEPFNKILIVSQSEISNYRFEGLKKELKNYGYDINCKNLTKAEISLEADTVLYNQAIREFNPQILIIIEKKDDSKLLNYGDSVFLSNNELWHYQVKDVRTKKMIYKAVFTDFNFKKIVKKFEKDGLIVNKSSENKSFINKITSSYLLN